MSLKIIREEYYKKLLDKCHKRHNYINKVEKKVQKKSSKIVDWYKLSSFIKKANNFKKMPEDFMPQVSDNFQIGYDGAYEHDF